MALTRIGQRLGSRRSSLGELHADLHTTYHILHAHTLFLLHTYPFLKGEHATTSLELA